MRPQGNRSKSKAAAKAQLKQLKANRRPQKAQRDAAGVTAGDVYEYDSDAAEEGAKSARRFDHVESFEYQLPADLGHDDIDSDAAFDSADEAKYGDFFAARATNPIKTGRMTSKGTPMTVGGSSGSGEIDMNEDDVDAGSDGEDDGKGEGSYVNFSELLSTRAADEEDLPPVQTARRSVSRAASRTHKSPFANDEFDDDDDADDDADALDGGAGGRSLDALVSSVVALDAGARAGARGRGTAREPERVEPRAEGEFNLTSRGAAIGVDDMVGALSVSAAFGALKTQLAKVDKAGLALAKPVDSGVARQAVREVAYQQAQEDMAKWQATVKANREADHVAFPLNAASKYVETNASLAAKFLPSTLLERQVAQVLGASTASEQTSRELTMDEEMALKNVPPKVLKERRHELQKLRALQSYFTAKASRVKKIKSKRFHKILKKAKLKQGEKDLALRASDPELAAEDQLKAERARAEERLTLRHKKSKWAKSLLGRHGLDTEARTAVQEQADLHQELRRKITLEKDGGDDGGDDSDDEDESRSSSAGDMSAGDHGDGSIDGSDANSDSDNAGADEHDLVKLQKIRKALSTKDAAVADSGIYKLAFMTRGLERKKSALLGDLADLEADIAGGGGGGGGGDDGDGGSAGVTSRPVLGGRRVFGVSRKAVAAPAKALAQAFDSLAGHEWGSDYEEERDELAPARDGAAAPVFNGENTRLRVTTNITVNAMKSSLAGKQEPPSAIAGAAGSATRPALLGAVLDPSVAPARAVGAVSENDAASNPWLAQSHSNAGLTPELVLTAFTRKSEKRLAKMQRGSRAVEAAAATLKATGGAAAVELAKATQGGGSGQLLRRNAAADADGAHGEGADDRLGADLDTEFCLADTDAAQRALIQEAFAGDNVVELEFLKEKALLVDSETVRDKDITLPGWGAWAGTGVPARKHRVIEKAPPVKPRKDSHLQHVVINEKMDRKAEQKMVASIPHPFKTQQDFERSIRQPLGPQWNSFKAVAELTTPKISVKAGTIIAPMRLTKVRVRVYEPNRLCPCR